MPQGHRAQAARHGWRARLAVAAAVARRGLFLAVGGGTLAALLGLGSARPASATGTRAEEAGAARSTPAGQNRLRLLISLTLLQERAASLAASRDIRPELRSFAEEMARYRRGQIEGLRAFARERGVEASEELAFEHRVIWENLAPLDFLALTRRYAEVQLQALEQEISGYEQAEQSGDAGLAALAAETLPDLRRLAEGARRAQEAVRP
jgi:putative membrane protein